MALETAPSNTVKVPPQLSNLLMRCSDLIMAAIPQQAPSSQAIAQCQLVGHRGCKDIKGVKENTFAAFDYALKNGMDGVELDLRWTKDKQLVVAHDPDLLRVHGKPESVSALTLKELKDCCPEVPTLGEVITRYKGKLSLYIELKKDDWADIPQQQALLIEALSPLTHAADYKIMSFDLNLLCVLDKISASQKVAIMHSNPSDIKSIVVEEQVGTVGGHYLLLSKQLKTLCTQHNIGLGVGFPASRNSLWRELNRGATFIFVDDPAKAKSWIS